MGFDIHRLVKGRSLILGGVRIPHPKGLLGHSDADVVLHALCDALLGAVGEGDIGTYFPDTDSRWENASSRIFVEKASELVRRRGLTVSNVDLVVLAQTPKIHPHREAIRKSVAKTLRVDSARVNLKAKTMEGLGIIGAKGAIGTYAVVLLESKRRRR